MNEQTSSTQVTAQATHRLRRRRLGICFGTASEVYLADPESQPPAIHLLTPEAFAEALRSKQIVARRWAVVIPRRDCLIKRLRLPASVNGEVRQMLEFELPSLVPRQNEEMCHDALELWRDDQGYGHLNVVMAYRSRIDAVTTPFSDAGLQPEIIMPSSLALLNWIQHCRPEVRDADCVFLCLGDEQLQTVVSSRGRLLAAREVAISPGAGGETLTAIEEIRRSVEHLDGIPDPGNGTHLVLAGPESLTGDIERQLASITWPGGTVPTVTRLPLETQVVTGPDNTICRAPCEVAALSALGASLAGPADQAEPFSLTPANWRERRHRIRRWFDLGVTAAVVVCAISLLYAMLAASNWRMDNQLALINREIAPIRDIAQDLAEKKNQVTIIRSQLAGKAVPLAVLAELYRLMPQGAHVSQVHMEFRDRDAKLVVRGTAVDLPQALEIPQLVAKSRWLIDVRSDGSQLVSRAGGQLAEFAFHGSILTTAQEAR